MARFLLAVVACLAVAAKATDPVLDYVKYVDLHDTASLTRNTDPNFRLPRTVLPSYYHITLTPRFNTALKPFTFDGLTVIRVQAQQIDVNQILLHMTHSEIETLTVTLGPWTATSTNLVQNSVLDPIYEFLRITLTVPMTVGQDYYIRVVYEGQIQGDHLMQGFYRSWYRTNEGEIRWIGTTQFQPGHARKAFPCFDEPYFKANFTFAIDRPAGYFASLSNMPIQTTASVTEGGVTRTRDTFYPTMRTSTYLLAFIVSDYAQLETNTGNRPFGLYGRRNAGTQGRYSQNVGIDLLREMETYTNFPYYNITTHMKLDQASVPDFSAGAMENWGLITYREALILFDEAQTTSSYQQRIATVISHEVAHMWFGNLVTCDWWNDLWLNEGFARYYQYFLTAKVETEFGLDVTFVAEQMRTSLLTDSAFNSHALTHDANSPAEVWNMFSTISYNKGACVLRMMEFLLGPQTFVKGLQIYLRNNAFKNTLPGDLYSALDEAAVIDGALTRYPGFTINQVMSSWVHKNGYPLITVHLSNVTGNMRISQHRFIRDSGGPVTDDLYNVPLTYTSQSNTNWNDVKPDLILDVGTTTVQRGANQTGWVIFNKQWSGLYRVNYDHDNWERIFATLNNRVTINDIHELNRAAIVDDWFHLARANVISYPALFRYLRFLEHDTSYAVWINAINGYNFLLRRLAHEAYSLELLRDSILQGMGAVITHLGFEERTNDTHLTKMLRTTVMSTACSVGHRQCNEFAVTAYAAFSRPTNPIQIRPNLRPWVYCSALRNGTVQDFDFLWRRYGASNVYNEKVDILGTLGCTRHSAKLIEFLNNIFEEDTVSGIRAQDVDVALSSAITGNEANTDVVFLWLTTNFQRVITHYYGLSGVGTVLNSLAGRMITESQITTMESFVFNTTTLAPLANTRSNIS